MLTRCGYDVFLQGEIVDLVIPNELAIGRDGWHSWFNDEKVTRHVDHGVFPNTRESQQVFMNSALSGRERLLLLVVPKDGDQAVGAASLSSINMSGRHATFGMVLSSQSPATLNRIFYGMEAKALIVQHGFEKMGLNRIYGGQVFELEGWQKYQLLFGFKPEGYKKASFTRGHKVFDTIETACLYEDYLRIVDKRGSYWPGKKMMLKYIKQQKSNDYLERFRDMVVQYAEDEFNAVLDQM